MQFIQPPFLKEGDKIGICCPSGKVSEEKIAVMKQQLEFWGFEVVLGNTVGKAHHNFAGTDIERIKDFQKMLDDDSIKAILFGRGGYGFVRIIDYINFKKFREKPKWLVGYSDITVLHNHAHSNLGIATLHAHMSGGYQPDEFDNDSIMSIYHALTGKKINYEIAVTQSGEVNSAEGVLVGGNLAIISDLIGTPSDIQTAGKILVLEDIGEYRYNIDRMLWQLYRSGKLDKLAGLIVGGFTNTQDNEIPFGMNEYEIVWEKVCHFDYPVCFGFPVGHQAANLALKMGVKHRLEMTTDKISLKEI